MSDEQYHEDTEAYTPPVNLLMGIGFVFIMLIMVLIIIGPSTSHTVKRSLELDQTVEAVSLYPDTSDGSNKASVYVDVSGSSLPYNRSTLDNGTLAMTHLLNRLHTVWVPFAELKRGHETRRFNVGEIHQIGRRLQKVNITNLRQIYDNLPGGTFAGRTSLQHATKSLRESLTSGSAGLGIIISDFETVIGEPVDSCPTGNAPYCVVEELRPLFQNTARPAGWWMIGITLPYELYKKPKTARPLFISLISYDIEATRTIVEKIVQDMKTDFSFPDFTPDIHVIEFSPADGWLPKPLSPWPPEGYWTFEDDNPFVLFGRDHVLKCPASRSKGVLTFNVSNDAQRSAGIIETPYRRAISARAALAGGGALPPLDLRTAGGEGGAHIINVTVPCPTVNGSRKSPDVLSVVLSMEGRQMSISEFPWVSDWTRGTGEVAHIDNLDILFAGALQVSRPDHLRVDSIPMTVRLFR